MSKRNAILTAAIRLSSPNGFKESQSYSKSNISKNLNFEMPSKVLLVDDEVDFVETLSERLETRRIGAAVVFDGEQALSFLEDEEPEVWTRRYGFSGRESSLLCSKSGR